MNLVHFLHDAQPFGQGHEVIQAPPPRETGVIILAPLQRFANFLLIPVQDLPTPCPHPLSGKGIPQGQRRVYPLMGWAIDPKPQHIIDPGLAIMSRRPTLIATDRGFGKLRHDPQLE
jgi:hypothetical protein